MSTDYKEYTKKIHECLYEKSALKDILSEVYRIDALLYEEELKQCPMCNSQVVIYEKDSISSPCDCEPQAHVRFYDIKCTRAGCYFEKGTGKHITDKNHLIREWNKRK